MVKTVTVNTAWAAFCDIKSAPNTLQNNNHVSHHLNYFHKL